MKKYVFLFFIALVMFLGGYILAVNFLIKNSNTQVADNKKLQTELVCMVNDAYMGIKQFPVPVDGKMYYGCCEQCVDKIKNIRQFRYAKDPLTGEEVDKAMAYIVRKSEVDPGVYYFKSKDNYLKYKSNSE